DGDVLLSRPEQERIFSAVTQGLSVGRPALRLAPPTRWRLPWLAWGGAAAAVALVAVLTVVRPAPENQGVGLKGAATPTVALIPLVGERTPTPHVVRALAVGGRFAPGELLLLRIRLDTPAWVYLISQKRGEPAELIWPLHRAAPQEAGEFEVAESGS